MKIHKIIRDFNNNEGEELMPLRLFSSELKFKSGRYCFWLLKRQIDSIYHKLRLVCEPSIDENFVIDQTKNLFYIEISVPDKNKNINKKQGIEHDDFPIKNEIFIYDVFYNPAALVDFKDLDKETIEFDLKILAQQYTSSTEVRKIIEGDDFKKINLKLLKEYPKPKLVFKLNKEFQDPIEYQNSNNIPLGIMEISNDSKKNYAYSLDCILKLKASELELPDDLFIFGKEYEIVESNPNFSDKGGIVPKGQSISSTLKKEIVNQKYIKIGNILPKNIVSIPVYINMSKLPNPFDKQEYYVEILSEFTSKETAKSISVNEKFIIKRDKQTTALMAFFKELGEEFVSLSNDVNLEERIQWTNKDENLSSSVFTIRLGNLAENYDDKNNRGEVKIKNLHFKFDNYDPSANAKIKEGLNIPFVIDNYMPNNDLLFKDDKNSFQDFVVKLPFKNITDIPNDLFRVTCKISFDYSVKAKNDDKDSFEHFEKNIKFTVEKNPGPAWLALDFGTSAFVAGYFTGDEFNEYKLVNLQKSFEEIVKKYRGGVGKYNKNNIDEYGTHYLSSAIKLNSGKKLFGFEPDNLVRLTPLINEYQRNRMIPYLKSLIGNKYLPNPDNIYDDLMYYNKKTELVQYKNSQIETNDVIKSTYQQLIKTYIIPTIDKQEKSNDINKIIITFPNNFSPKQLSIIRAIVDNNFKHIFKPNYLTFISESDAVASYYLGNWGKLNKSRTEEQKNAIKDKEYVLVYDMGAGTLDITYFVIITSENDKKSVKLIGKIGNTLAGNYFDYILADTIVDEYKKKFIDNLTSINTKNDSEQTRKAKYEFKRFVKETIKPVLYNKNDFELDPAKNDNWKSFLKDSNDVVKLNLSILRNHKNIKEYINQNSSEILNNMFELYSLDDNRIDTIIFSGRGVQLADLKKSIIESIKNNYNSEPYKIDIEHKKLKSVVVEGALQFATLYNNKLSKVKIVNRNLMSRYGILYNDGNSFKFKELLNPQTKPTCTTPIYNNGLSIYTYDTDEYCAEDAKNGLRAFRPLTVDLSNSQAAWLIKTYSNNPAYDYEQGKTEMITKIISINISLINQSVRNKVKVRLQVTQNNNLKFYYDNIERNETEPITVDFENDKLFRKSMWPYY